MTALRHMPDAEVILWRAKSASYPLLAETPKNADAEPRRYSRGRWRVADGASPKRDWYSAAKRPKCQNPYRVAISVTVIMPEALSRKARRARCIRRKSRYRLGLMPSCSWQHTRNVRPDTPIILQSSGMYSAWASFASRTPRNRRMGGYFNTIEDLGFFKNDRTDIRIFQTQHTPARSCGRLFTTSTGFS
jgi:hypothetical protein